MSEVLENVTYKERVKDLDLFSLEKRKVIQSVFQYLKDTYSEDIFFTRVHIDRTRSNGYK